MELFIVQIHSAVDVMTNSSSEIFISSTQKELGTIKTWLQSLITANNLIDSGNDTFEKVFREPYRVTTKDQALKVYRTICNYTSHGYPGMFSWEHPDFYEKWKQEKGCWEKIQQEEEKFIESKKEDIFKALKGKLIIESARDNSIPWGIVENVEDTLNATRIHLG